MSPPADPETTPQVEYRITWNASSNISFQGETDWIPWGGDPDATASQIEIDLCKGGGLSEGLEIALEASGFEWNVETREVDHDH